MTIKQVSSTFGARRTTHPRVSAKPEAFVKFPEKRRARRTTSVGQGAIQVPGFRLKLPCRIVDTSATGARLELCATSAQNLPERVVVVFAGDRSEVDAIVKWRSQQQFGVHFVSVFRKIEKKVESV